MAGNHISPDTDLYQAARLFQEHYPTIQRCVRYHAWSAYRQLGSSQVDRRDLEHEGYVEAMLKLTRFDANRGSVRTFVDKVVRNRMRSIVRARRRDRWLLSIDELLDEHLTAVAMGYAAEDFRIDVEKLLAGLTPRDRQFCLLLMQHHVAEASRLAGMARSSAYSILARLRDEFQKAGLGRQGIRRRPATPLTRNSDERGR
jgi:RNA polymerase sigma factor (sigma-70 family)